jgi:hypothetical protein
MSVTSQAYRESFGGLCGDVNGLPAPSQDRGCLRTALVLNVASTDASRLARGALGGNNPNAPTVIMVEQSSPESVGS